MKVLLLTRTLNPGGAERQLVVLAKGLKKKGDKVVVLTFYSGGPLEKELESSGVSVVTIGKRSRWDLIGFFLRLILEVHRADPDILYPFNTGPNLVALAIRFFLRRLRVVWGIRAAYLDLSPYDWFTRWTYYLQRRLSRFPDLIIVNSQAGLKHALMEGFPEKRTKAVPNGIDLDKFRPNKELGEALRQMWGVAEEEVLVGLVARLDPVKGHKVFLDAAAICLKKRKDLKFVCVGGGSSKFFDELRLIETRLNLTGRLLFPGPSQDVASSYSALDLLVSASHGEGFSNVIAEAMACGLPCVVTDVGDSAIIVGNAGTVVPPGAPEKLAKGILSVLEKAAREPQEAGLLRGRIAMFFSNQRMVKQTRELLCSLL